VDATALAIGHARGVKLDPTDGVPGPVRGEQWIRDAVGEVTARLNEAGSAQEIADAVGEVVHSAAGWFGVVLGVTDPVESVLQQYWCAPLRDSISARYMRIPLSLDTPQTRAVRTAAPVFVPDAAALQAQFPGPFRAARTTGLGPVSALPLTAPDGRPLGALAVMWTEDDVFGAVERALVERVAEVTSAAVNRVHDAARERSVAVSLQNAFLTLTVRSHQAVVSAQYRSSDRALQIGGDWYDAIERPDGRVFVTVGDTVGSGLDAAATMGRLRSSSAITALQTVDPARVLQYLDEYAAHVPGATMATVAIAVYEPARQRVRYVCAGHLPPMLVRPSGSVEPLWGGRSWPLDVDGGARRPPPATAAFPPGSTLFLYTDGLIERRDASLDVGLVRLASSLRRHWTLPVPLLLEAVLDDFGIEEGRGHDDTALIALRSVGESEVHFVDVLGADRDGVGPARHRVQAWLERAGIRARLAEQIIVAVNEVIANAVEHGSDFDPTKLVTVEGSLRDRQLVVTVTDDGQWRPGVQQDAPERGRGFVMIEQLCDDVRIETGPFGTAVTLFWTDVGQGKT
jgi:anti-sigma regulatory factor (Ser/Thr protein kinase)